NHVSGFRDLTDSYHYLIYHWCASYSVRIDGQRPLFEQFVLNKDDDSLQCIKIFIPIEQN
ncbi:MAG: hypothetical protein KDK38_12465, partial [Leptospiraceae bacterium]|nr:hypothetical protein [Leptospiraceae bacterium]